MKVALLGDKGPVAHAVHVTLEKRGHQVVDHTEECVIYFPGTVAELENIVAAGSCKRLVLRSHAYAYGSSTKNPGLISEERISLLPANAPERRWLELEAAVAKHANSAMIRLTNVLAVEEGDLLVRQISRRYAMALAGHDPNAQFLHVEDAASALVAAVEAKATGLFNAAGDGAIPLKEAYRAAGTRRIPVLKPVARLSRFGAAVDQLQYNWTVSSARARRELGWCASRTSTEALAEFLARKPGAAGIAHAAYDDWGLDLDYIRAWGAWFWFLRNIYWRIDHEGLENIPASGRALFVSNHRGFMPLDAVMHLSLAFTHRNRIPRFLIIHTLLRFPFLCNFLTKLGGVIASQENASRLFAEEQLVGIFPEGIRGTFLPYRQTYCLRDFSKSGFAKMAIENQAPIIPAAVIGHSEIFPIIGRINSRYITREWGWPYLPIAPMFPFAPVPLPSKWHIRVLPPVPLQGLKPSDAENHRIVREFSGHIQQQIQFNIDEMLGRRKHIFWGQILSGSRAASLHLPVSSASGEMR
jgi:1-acyl-sn-glycerol-3-phosphate acyltransferase/nucleoside-diphosphate-sugar epimerase